MAKMQKQAHACVLFFTGTSTRRFEMTVRKVGYASQASIFSSTSYCLWGKAGQFHPFLVNVDKASDISAGRIQMCLRAGEVTNEIRSFQAGHR